MKAISLIVIALLLSTITLLGQSDRQNLEKYWYMRKQLKDRFLRVGDKPGYNIPAGIISSGPEWHDDPGYTVRSRIKWGDGTIELGWYIGVLATEYKVLRNNNLDGSETLQELFLAIQTIDRLDQVAEKVWSYYDEDDVPLCENLVTCGTDQLNHSIPDSLSFVQNNLAEVPYDEATDTWDPSNTSTAQDGFIIRDDVPHTILEDFDFPYTSMSSSMARPKDAQYSYFAPDGYIHNNYMSNSPPANEMSQDQLFSLFMGLVLAKEYCSGATYTGTNVGNYASSTALRLLDYYNGSWIIKNPVRDKQVLIGGNSAWFGPSLNRLKNYFTDGSKHYNPVQGLLVDNPCNGSVNLALMAIITSTSNSINQADLDDMVDGEGTAWEFYILLNNTLYGHSNNNYKLEDVKEDLDLCPCRGPHIENILWTPDYTYTINGQWTKIYPPDGIPPKWNRGNRFKTAQCEPISNSPGVDSTNWFSEQYNGLDYMLLYNLYRINYDGYDDFRYMDMRDAFASGTLPAGNEGTINNIRYYNSFGYMKTDLKLLAPSGGSTPAGAEVYARKHIRLMPGFYVQGGARFLAKIHEDDFYECSSGTFKSVPASGNLMERPNASAYINTDNVVNKMPDEQPISAVRISIFPNPATEFVQINGIDCIQNVAIINDIGMNVRNLKGTANRIDLNGISSGAYFLRITDCESKEHFAKLLVSQ